MGRDEIPPGRPVKPPPYEDWRSEPLNPRGRGIPTEWYGPSGEHPDAAYMPGSAEPVETITALLAEVEGLLLDCAAHTQDIEVRIACSSARICENHLDPKQDAGLLQRAHALRAMGHALCQRLNDIRERL